MAEQTDEELFSEFLAQFKGGTIDLELTAALKEIVTACRVVRKPGTLKLEIKITPGDDVIMGVAEKVTAVLPKHTRASFPLFADQYGGLSDTHPSKKQLPLDTPEAERN